jgi:Na+-driven multidrug efflux pump
MELLGSTQTILPYSKQYGMWVLIACPFMVGSFILNNNLRYEGKAFYAMIGLGIGGLTNIGGDYLFIRICGLGVFGAGLSTAISQVLGFGLLFWFYQKMAQSDIRIKYISRDFRIYTTIISIGIPALIRQGLMSLSNGVLNNVTKAYGDAAIAAMSVVNRFSAFIMCVGLGIGQGFQPVAAFNYQAKKYKRVKQGLCFTMAAGFCCIGILSLFGFIFASQIVYAFQESERVNEIGTFALRCATIGVLFLPMSVTVNMLYQSIRKALLSSILSLFRSGMAFIPLVIIGTRLWGLRGIQIAQPIADVIAGLVSIPFIIHFLRKTPDE